jgi:RNase P/RNase MRP subunit p30
MNKSQFLSKAHFYEEPSDGGTIKSFRLSMNRGDVDIIYTCGRKDSADGFVYINRANGDEINITLKQAIRLTKIRGII